MWISFVDKEESVVVILFLIKAGSWGAIKSFS